MFCLAAALGDILPDSVQILFLARFLQNLIEIGCLRHARYIADDARFGIGDRLRADSDRIFHCRLCLISQGNPAHRYRFVTDRDRVRDKSVRQTTDDDRTTADKLLRCFFLAVADDNRVRGFIEITLILHRPLPIFVLGFRINQRQTVADRNIIFSLHARYQCRVAGCPRGCRANVPADTEFDILRMNHPRCHINPDRDIRRFRPGDIVADEDRPSPFRREAAPERNALFGTDGITESDRHAVRAVQHLCPCTDSERLRCRPLHTVIFVVRSHRGIITLHMEEMHAACR